MNRHQLIIKTSVIAIITNIVLGFIKAFIGWMSGSLSIVLDAINNFTDALSSLITIIGTKLAGKRPDKKHPLGYGRIEFMTSLFIAILIFYAGIKSIQESVSTIIEHKVPNYEYVSLIILVITIVIKLWLANYMKNMGKKTSSKALINSSIEARHDTIVSISTIISAFIFIFFHIPLEGYLGFILSLLIVKSAYDMLMEGLSQILGERIDENLSKQIKETITSIEQVEGAYDLFLSALGPNLFQGSVHIEVNDTLNALEIDHISRKIEKIIYQKYHVLLTGIGIYAINTKDEESIRIKHIIESILSNYPQVIQMHGYYLDKETKYIQFDIIIDLNYPDFDELIIHKALQEKLSDYKIQINKDIDISD